MDGYLAGLTPDVARELTAVNATGLAALRRYLSTGQAVAFLGAGVSAPLYPLWNGLIADLIDAAAGHGLDDKAATTCRALAGTRPDAVVEVLRRQLGVPLFREVLREALRVRRDEVSGRTWTPGHELVCRCPFRGVVTTNYDPGIVDARMRVRPTACSTGFTSWNDELALDRWRTGEVFGDDELPVLFAHGYHNRPDEIVLATTEYRRAYAGKLASVLGELVTTAHLVWIGFSFADQRISSVLREVAERTGTRVEPGAATRHVALMAWDPDSDQDPTTLRTLAEIEYGADLVLYPAPGGDHAALQALLADLTDDRYPPVVTVAPTAVQASQPALPRRWVPAAEPVPNFTGRVEELARLDRWAVDPDVRLVGVTAWGGAGKTALVTEWVERHTTGVQARAGLRGVFGWSFYANPSAHEWAETLLAWAREQFGAQLYALGPAAVKIRAGQAVLAVLKTLPVLLVLDGLEVLQEGPEGGEFGRLLDGTLREALTGACRQDNQGLVMLTSRFPFADLEGFDGTTARMIDVPPFTPTEGSTLLAAAGADWLPSAERRSLVDAVDGHALGVAVLADICAHRPPTNDLAHLRDDLIAAGRTDARVRKVLTYYADRLTPADRYLVAAVALFTHPIRPDDILTVTTHQTFAGQLDGWTAGQVETAARTRLSGILSWHPDGTLSAHPLVRDTFRGLALGAAETAADTTLTGIPGGTITTRDQGLRIVEAVELLLDADQWTAADNLYTTRTNNGYVWMSLPAARLGQRAATAFVATPTRRHACPTRLSPRQLGFYLASVGLFAMHAGDMTTARDHLHAAIRHYRDADQPLSLAIGLRNLTECLLHLGDTAAARDTADEALTSATTDGDRNQIIFSYGYRGWAAALAGDTPTADQAFHTADRIEHADDHGGRHLYSGNGVQWGDFLARSGRPGPARTLTDRNHQISHDQGWNENVARCRRLLAALDLAAGNLDTARDHIDAALATFRDGDYLTNLADSLPLAADIARHHHDLDTAAGYIDETLTITTPRQLWPAHTAAHTARAHLHADHAHHATGQTRTTHLARGRDAADTALRLARRHHLPWHELDALTAHTHLDQTEHTDHGWAAQRTALHRRLVPPDLDPDPLTTIEREVAAGRASSRRKWRWSR